jgi:glycosyltransferase involved in cell wall biosynthesis
MLDLDAAAGLSPPPPGTVRVGLIATLAWWKGHTVFLQALSLLPPELPFRAYVVGGALYETQRSQHTVDGLRELAAKLGIEDRVGFTGFVEDAAAAMRALDIVVHASSEPEPFGLVIAEAMACGRPLVVSLAGGAAELVRVGENALGHRPGDSASLAQCISVLINDPSLRRALGQAGRVTAERSFDRTRLAGQLVPIYRAAGAFG